MTSTLSTRKLESGIGESVTRPDAVEKVSGRFEFIGDISVDGMLWGATRRADVTRARIQSIDIAPAVAMTGVEAVLTADDVPDPGRYGLEEQDQPVLASDEVVYSGEPIAIVAAIDRPTAERAAAAIEVVFEELEPVVDPEEAEANDQVFRRMTILRGDQGATGDVVVEGFYEVGMQDQAPLGTEVGLAIPDGTGGVDLRAASQWLHADHEQIVSALGLSPDSVRVQPGGVGGAFGAREDVNLHIHLCMLALYTGRPVKMTYHRSESFVGHVHRHPARMWYRHEATKDGKLVRLEARILLDGGAFASTTPAVLANACYFAGGPYRVGSVLVEGIGVRTNNPPCGAMRGFGAVQSCFAYEAQMDSLAAALGMDPLELRRQNLLRKGDELPTTGQLIETSLPTEEVLDSIQALPLPDEVTGDDPLTLPGGTGLTTPRDKVRRGVGYALGIKNLGYSEGFDDYAEARVALKPHGAEVETAAMEVGQGLVTVIAQIVRTALGIENVLVRSVDTSRIGSSGSTSASRQTQMTGGAALEAATDLRNRILTHYAADHLDDEGVWRDEALIKSIDGMCSDRTWEEMARFHHPLTEPPNESGQGVIHADFAVAAHRAVVDVDPELGLVRVVSVDTAQDVGKALNPESVRGQIEGGIMQGVGLAVMEELIIDRGRILNANFTDYLLPTMLDAPSVEAILIEQPSSWGPYGAKGVGEPPTISSTAAVAAAIRNATGKALNRVPVRPQDIVGID